MIAKLFVIGSPGCGKSTAACYIRSLLKVYGWSSDRINDYQILREMFLEEERNAGANRWFKASDHNGFDILNFTAFDVALQLLEKRAAELVAQNETTSASKPLFLIIEFARNDYVKAFQLFSPEFLQDAYFLYLETPVETCKKRIQARIAKPENKQTEDDYYVSDYIFEAYYDLENDESLTEVLEKDCKIERKRIIVLRNNEELKVIFQEIATFIRYITNDMMGLSLKGHLKTVSESA